MEIESPSSPTRRTSPKVSVANLNLTEDNRAQAEETDKSEEIPVVDSNFNIIEDTTPSDEVQEVLPANSLPQDMGVSDELIDIPARILSSEFHSHESLLFLHNQDPAGRIQDSLESAVLRIIEDLIVNSEPDKVESVRTSSSEVIPRTFEDHGLLNASPALSVQSLELNAIFTRSLQDNEALSNVSLPFEEIPVTEPETVTSLWNKKFSIHPLQDKPSVSAVEIAAEEPNEFLGNDNSSDYVDLSEDEDESLSKAREFLKEFCQEKWAACKQQREQTTSPPTRSFNLLTQLRILERCEEDLSKAKKSFREKQTWKKRKRTKSISSRNYGSNRFQTSKLRRRTRHKLGVYDSLHQLGSAGLPRTSVAGSNNLSARTHYLLWRRNTRFKDLIDKIENHRNSPPLILPPEPKKITPLILPPLFKNRTPWQIILELRKRWKNKELPFLYKPDPKNNSFRLRRNKISDSKLIQSSKNSNTFWIKSGSDKLPWSKKLPERSFKPTRSRSNRLCNYLYCKWAAFINIFTRSKKRKLELKASNHSAEEYDEIIELTRYF